MRVGPALSCPTILVISLVLIPLLLGGRKDLCGSAGVSLLNPDLDARHVGNVLAHADLVMPDDLHRLAVAVVAARLQPHPCRLDAELDKVPGLDGGPAV